MDAALCADIVTRNTVVAVADELFRILISSSGGGSNFRTKIGYILAGINN